MEIPSGPEGKGTENGWTDGIPEADLIPVPASFQDFYTDKDTREYAGDFWYETEVFVPEEYAGKMWRSVSAVQPTEQRFI